MPTKTPTPPTRYYKCGHCSRTLSTSGTPGKCICGTRHPYPWKVSLEPWPAEPRGFVRVLSSRGSQFLHGPSFREDPNAWVPDPETPRGEKRTWRSSPHVTPEEDADRGALPDSFDRITDPRNFR